LTSENGPFASTYDSTTHSGTIKFNTAKTSDTFTVDVAKKELTIDEDVYKLK
jgi:hypothetical protein